MSRCDLKNDQCALHYLNNRSQTPLQQIIDQGTQPCQPFCEPHYVDQKPDIHVSNYIRGLNYGPFKKWCTNKQTPVPKTSKVPTQVCREIIPETTRLTNPPPKGVSISRWDYICPNMQGYSSFPCFDYMVNSRNVMKDNHRPVVRIPEPQEKPCEKYYDEVQYKNFNHEPMFPSTHTTSCQRLNELTK